MELDINPPNIMLTMHDESVLDNFERAETEGLSPTKVINDTRIIYSSSKPGLPRNCLLGQPVLCDFGEAQIGESYRGLVQPELYRVPGVFFDMR